MSVGPKKFFASKFKKSPKPFKCFRSQVQAPSKANPTFQDDKYIYEIVIIHQNERGLVGIDPSPWSDITNKKALVPIDFSELTVEWEWVSPRWLVHITPNTDFNGWSYATTFGSVYWHSDRSRLAYFVRRRRWFRVKRKLKKPPFDITPKDETFVNPEYREELCYMESWKDKRVGVYNDCSKVVRDPVANDFDVFIKNEIKKSLLPKIKLSSRTPSISTTASYYPELSSSMSTRSLNLRGSYDLLDTDEGIGNFRLGKNRRCMSTCDLSSYSKVSNFDHCNPLLSHKIYSVESGATVKDSKTNPLAHDLYMHNMVPLIQNHHISPSLTPNSLTPHHHSASQSPFLNVSKFDIKSIIYNEPLPFCSKCSKHATFKPQDLSSRRNSLVHHALSPVSSRHNNSNTFSGRVSESSDNSLSSTSTKSGMKHYSYPPTPLYDAPVSDTESELDDFYSTYSQPFVISPNVDCADDECAYCDRNSIEPQVALLQDDLYTKDQDVDASSDGLLLEISSAKEDDSNAYMNLRIDKAISKVVKLESTILGDIPKNISRRSDRAILSSLSKNMDPSLGSKSLVFNSTVLWILVPNLYRNLAFECSRNMLFEIMSASSSYVLAERFTGKIVLFNCFSFDLGRIGSSMKKHNTPIDPSKKQLCPECYVNTRYDDSLCSFFYFDSKNHSLGISPNKQMNFYTRKIKPSETDLFRSCVFDSSLL
ncbi:hypothetical protein AYI68_g5902 [Smittium mucronatum]|uniref:Meiotically up-regulated gene 65 protein n=1 Tax=Smittium mucronatum TaxID=133383 RepID=A0A1R0GSY8_9FUNG|nr:hypothetical protein AYI68_g5902 [Smittium mucronatum]